MAGNTTMTAVQYDCYGGGAEALKFVKTPVPSPKAHEVLIKVEAASINPLDWKIQDGIQRPLLPPKFPFTPAMDVAGEIVKVGSKVKTFKAGDKVVCLLNVLKGGGLAEYAVTSASLTVIRPAEVSATECVGLCVGGITALQALKYVGTKFDGTDKPTNILITAASGGVGHYAVQLAKLANFHVTATCGARNIQLIKSLGADEVLDYNSPEGASLKSPSGRKYDVVIHCSAGIDWSIFEPNLSTHGKVIYVTPTIWTYISYYLHKLTFPNKQLVPILMIQRGDDLKFLVQLAKEGKVRTVIDSKYPLNKAKDAWSRSIDGHATGKIIVEIM